MSISYIRLVATLFFLSLVPGSVIAGPGNRYSLRSIDDPLILEYRFVQLETSETHLNEIWLPIGSRETGQMGLCLIGNNWIPSDSLTSVIFYEDLFHRLAITHYNLKTAGINSLFPFNFNNSGSEDIVVNYSWNDSVWIEILSIDDNMHYKKMLETGEDLNSNGYWDGHGYFCNIYDFNHDGYVELLIGIDTGYDLYPRKLICLDWKNDQILWEYKLAGIINNHNFFVTELGDSKRPYIVFGISSKGNAAIERDMDDRHSYTVVLDDNGREVWKVITGNSFTSSYPLPIDYNGDGYNEVFVPRFVGADKNDSISTEDFICIYEIYDRDGNLIASPPNQDSSKVGRGLLIDLENDGVPEIVCCHQDNNVYIYDQQMRMLKTCQFYSVAYIWDCHDFLDIGKNQFLIETADNRMVLTDLNFYPLAQTTTEEVYDYGMYFFTRNNQHKADGRIVLNSRKGKFGTILELKPTPWFTIFSRKPLLAFLAAFVPLSIIIAVIWLILAKFRQKNRIISAQRDQLDNALNELKNTQEKLIAAEKYKQAKDIAGGVAHEIHNALSPAMNSLETLRRLLSSGSAADPNRIERLLDLSDRAITRASNMTELVNRYSRLDLEKKHDPVKLHSIINNIVEDHGILIKQLNVTVTIDIDKKLTLSFFEPHLHSVLNNLFVNALDAVMDVEKRSIEIAARNENKKIRIELTDSGRGISGENLPRIFDVFFSTKPGTGTGLGLAMVKKIVELYDGRVDVKSVLDKGTKFIILLPSQ